MKTIKEFNKELEYIINTSVNGSTDYRELASFNQDYDCFNRYIDMQANEANKNGFPGIAQEMRKQKL